MNRRWLGLALTDEQQALVELIDTLAASRLTRRGDECPDAIATARRVLAEHGLWTLGADETTGADLTTILIALARLAGTWPALAWASAQAHAAAIVLRGKPEWAGLLSAMHRDGSPMAVVDPATLTLVRTDGRLTGTVDRVDPAGGDFHLLLLRRAGALILRPDQFHTGARRRRTGLDGAHTMSVRLDLRPDSTNVLDGIDASRSAAMLRLGGAAVAAGIAGAAADAARAYSGSRYQFGAPLTALPPVRDSLLRQASAARDAMVAAVSVELSQPAEAATVLCSACDRAIDVAAAAVQSHGGYGYLADYPVEAMLRDAVSLRCAAGAAEAVRSAGTALAAGSDGEAPHD